MFLPVLLMGRFGTTGWVVFTIPNVIGAAAMGWVLSRPGSSERVVAEHRTACLAFSAVTVAFQAYFLFWMSRLGVIRPSWAIAAATAGVVVGLVGRRRAAVDLALAGVVFAVSLTVLVVGLRHPHFGHADVVRPTANVAETAGLAATCVLGFLLCPYLDLTFHRTAQANPPAGRKVAFGVGFGVVFFSMLVLTPLYAGDFHDLRPGAVLGSFGFAGLTTWVALHFCGQIGFTWAAHLRAVPRPKWDDAGLWASAAVLVAAGGLLVVRRPTFDAFFVRKETGEVVYRMFMAFYGLVFPTYVWLCMVPLRGPAVGPTPAAMVAWLVTVLVASPFYWMGFVAERELWLFPGVAVVLASRLFVRSRPGMGVGPAARTGGRLS